MTTEERREAIAALLARGVQRVLATSAETRVDVSSGTDVERLGNMERSALPVRRSAALMSKTENG